MRSANPESCQCLSMPFGISQPAHVGILCRRDVEQTIVTPSEVIGSRWRRILKRLLLQPRISVEGMLLALEPFLVGKFLTRGDGVVLRLDVCGVGPGRFGAAVAVARAKATTETVDLQAAREPFQISLLLIGEVGRDSFDFHSGDEAPAATLWLNGDVTALDPAGGSAC